MLCFRLHISKRFEKNGQTEDMMEDEDARILARAKTLQGLSVQLGKVRLHILKLSSILKSLIH